jgi:hypothetical protein
LAQIIAYKHKNSNILTLRDLCLLSILLINVIRVSNVFLKENAIPLLLTCMKLTLSIKSLQTSKWSFS